MEKERGRERELDIHKSASKEERMEVVVLNSNTARKDEVK